MRTPTPALRRNLLIGLLAFLFLAAFAWIFATRGPLAPVKVTIAQTGEVRLERSLFGIGTVEARRSHAIGPTVAGRVASVWVDQGDRVQAGQLLAEMEPVDLDARLAASTAAAARAEQLAQSAQAAAAEAASRARLARASADRYAELQGRNFVSRDAADAKAHEATAAAAAHEAATAALAAAREEVRRARAELAGAGRSRDNLRLTSPVAGVVSGRLAEPGSTVVAGQAVVQVIDPGSLWLRVRIDQGRSAGLDAGLPAAIALRSRPGVVLEGRVARVDLVGDAVAEERIANVTFDTPPGPLAIGELAEVTLRLPSGGPALAIPAAALKRHQGIEGVWSAAAGRARFLPVTAGAATADGLVEIHRGLAAGDAVIVHSSRMLAGDLRIRVVDDLAGGR